MFGEVFTVNTMLQGKHGNQLMSIHKHPACDYNRGHSCKQFIVNCLMDSHGNEGILSSPYASVLTTLLHRQQEKAFSAGHLFTNVSNSAKHLDRKYHKLYV